ncbi:MAG TPA: AIR synthase-related protein, partial [Gemmatimonadales bacterium]|nr:AIR synthase-related protein [Gemmatimonadales bacterium]
LSARLGATRPEVLVGPRPGCDGAVVKVGAGRVMAVTTDPLSVIPALGFERSAVLACHLIASDLWATGIPPAYAAVDFNLPPQITDHEFERYWSAMSTEWQKLGVAVVTGHTGRYAGCDYSIVGAATLIGVGDEGRYVTPTMARPGDRVIVTKGCAIETTAIAAHLIPARLALHTDDDGVARARAMLDQVSVVLDCRAALRVGVRDRGVTALHDATEGGVLGGLIELAHACGHDLRIERARIPLAPEAVAACAAWGGIDPYWALSEGTLIVCARPEHAAAVLAAIAEEGIVAAEIGEVMPGDGSLWLTDEDGAVHRHTEPQPDPYWAAYARAISEGWQ